MIKNKDLPDSATHPQSGLSLSLFFSPMPFILRVPLDPAEAEPQRIPCLFFLSFNSRQWIIAFQISIPLELRLNKYKCSKNMCMSRDKKCKPLTGKNAN